MQSQRSVQVNGAVRRIVTAALLVLTAACDGTTLQPGDSLSGRWVSSSALLEAGQDSVQFRSPCQVATFGPIVIDANRMFVADSRRLEETGNIIHSPGDFLHIHGTVAGNTVTLQLYVIRSSGGGSDPLDITLTSARFQPALVCTA